MLQAEVLALFLMQRWPFENHKYIEEQQSGETNKDYDQNLQKTLMEEIN